MFNVESIEPARRSSSSASRPQGRVRVDRLQQALPGDRPDRARPGRAARAVQPRLPRLGRADPQRGRLRDHRPPALLPLAAGASSPRRSTRRRSTTPGGCSSGCATRWRSRASTPTCPDPGTRGWSRSRRRPSRWPARRLLRGPCGNRQWRARGEARERRPSAARSRRSACAGRGPSLRRRDQVAAHLEVLLPGEVGGVRVRGQAGAAGSAAAGPRGSAVDPDPPAASVERTGTRTASGKPSGADPGEDRGRVAARRARRCARPSDRRRPRRAACGSRGSSPWPERTSSRCESWISRLVPRSPSRPDEDPLRADLDVDPRVVPVAAAAAMNFGGCIFLVAGSFSPTRAGSARGWPPGRRRRPRRCPGPAPGRPRSMPEPVGSLNSSETCGLRRASSAFFG